MASGFLKSVDMLSNIFRSQFT